MKRSKFSEEQIIGVLREQEAGVTTAEVCRRHGISSATFYAHRRREREAETAARRRDAGQRCAVWSALPSQGSSQVTIRSA